MIRRRLLVMLLVLVACTSAPIIGPSPGVTVCESLPAAPVGQGANRVPNRVLARNWIAETDSDEVLWIDPRTLRPIGQERVPIPAQTWSQALHANGRRLALGAGGVWIVDAKAMRVTTSHRVRGGVMALAWVGNRLAVLTQTAIRWLDRGGREVSASAIGGRPVRWGTTARGLVALTEGDAATSRPATLVLSGPEAVARSVELDDVVAGYVPHEGQFGTVVTPGMAIDEAGDRAVIVQTDGPIAEVDLRTMAVTYHGERSGGMLPSAKAKLSDWSSIEAQWLTDDLVAVWGTSSITRIETEGIDETTMREVPVGLSVLDVRTWSRCEIDPSVVDVAITDGRVFARATGGRRSDDSLVAYDASGRERWRRFGHRRTFDIRAHGPFVYAVMSWDGWRVRIIDAQTGEFVGVREHRPPTLLVPGSSEESE
jgi:hypothetical protein